MNSMLFLQIAPEIVTETVVEPTMNLWTMAKYGGPIMIVLFLMLAFAVYLFIERVITIKQASTQDNSFMDRIKDYIHNGNIGAAQKLCRDTDTPASRLVDKGISRLGRPSNDVLVAVENVGNLEIAKLEKGLVFLASISGGAPMIGFLGTVTGMVQTFYNMSLNSSGAIELSDLSSGMYQAMVTTIGGLVVGIFAYFAYNYLVSRVDSVVRILEARTIEFMDILNEPVK